MGMAVSAKRILKGDRLADARKQLGYTQEELADKVETNYVTINRYERGVYDPSPSMLFRLANILSVSVDWLLGRVDERTTVLTESDLTNEELEILKAYRKSDMNEAVKLFMSKIRKDG